MLEGYPTLKAITALLDDYLKSRHELFFGEHALHPFLELKPYKDIHDPIWGTSGFSWRELALMDTPLMQRLRRIRQTGLAFEVYPCAQHTRFEHSLGVTVVATKVFDAVVRRHAGRLRLIVKTLEGTDRFDETLFRWRQELRLAALLHDTGHSILSHTSERVYGKIPMLEAGADELTDYVGAEKKAGEVISFCLSRTGALQNYLERAKKKLMKETPLPDEFSGEPNMENVSLLIVGRSRHPLLQFLGDIISSGFDADKLDYLLRDASAAGLPLRYDLERYLATVYLPESKLKDGEDKLEKLYQRVGVKDLAREAADESSRYPYFRAFRLKLPKRSMNTIEQVTICKLMLYSYIYHHPKVRAGEGFFERVLSWAVRTWRTKGKSDADILALFMDFDDAALHGAQFLRSMDPDIRGFSYRLLNRLLPRVVYEIVSSPSGAEGKLLADFFSKLGDSGKRAQELATVEHAMGTDLIGRRQELGPDPTLACLRAGAWLDVPSLPTFEGMDELVGETDGKGAVKIGDMFPINKWTEAYHAHRYAIRVYAFSEYTQDVAVAARTALEQVTGISDPEFYKRCRRDRT
jgi:HD superfamily phosphohydrolase